MFDYVDDEVMMYLWADYMAGEMEDLEDEAAEENEEYIPDEDLPF
jgi:hypothetical protein